MALLQRSCLTAHVRCTLQMETSSRPSQVVWPLLSSLVVFWFHLHGPVSQRGLACAGRIEYFYAKVAAWQISNDDGTEVFLFPDGHRQAHHPDGSKELAYPNGSFSLTDASGHAAKIQSLSAAIQQQEPVLLI